MKVTKTMFISDLIEWLNEIDQKELVTVIKHIQEMLYNDGHNNIMTEVIGNYVEEEIYNEYGEEIEEILIPMLKYREIEYILSNEF